MFTEEGVVDYPRIDPTMQTTFCERCARPIMDPKEVDQAYCDRCLVSMCADE